MGKKHDEKETEGGRTYIQLSAPPKQLSAPPEQKKDGGLAGVQQNTDRRNAYYYRIMIEGEKKVQEFLGKVKIKCVTYHIYWHSATQGQIEKHVPKKIDKGYEDKYKYVYHDQAGNEHEICTVEWNTVKEKKNGVIISGKPKRNDEISDKTVSEGNTQRRVLYTNGDVVEYGIHPTKGHIWRLYASTGKDVELVRMSDALNYNNRGISIRYTFSATQRRYTSPGAFAGFIGALADCSLTLETTGSCFQYGSCFPSSEHVNGKSIDTLYLNDTDEQTFITAMHKFHFTKQITGKNKKTFQYAIKEKVDPPLHNSHLHSGFDETSVQEIKE